MSERPLPTKLRALLDAERERPDAPDDMKEVAAGRLAALLGPGAGLEATPANGGGGRGAAEAPPVSSPASIGKASSSGAATKLVAAFLVGGLAGGGAVAALVRPAERVVTVYVRASAEPSTTAASSAAPPSSVPALATRAVEEAPSRGLAEGRSSPSAPARPASSGTLAAPSAAASDAKARDTDLAAERALLERARSALSRGDGVAALAATSQHEREFPRGQLVEEREVLAVQALATAGRTHEAVERGARFRKAYPASLLLPTLDEALH